MNWISNYVRPRINSLFSRRDVPENLWTKCSECGTMLFHRELSQNINVCPNCDHHMNISPRDRLKNLFDDGKFIELDVPKPINDPLSFKDQKKYPERMKSAQKKTESEEAMVVAEGYMGRARVVTAVGFAKAAAPPLPCPSPLPPLHFHLAFAFASLRLALLPAIESPHFLGLLPRGSEARRCLIGIRPLRQLCPQCHSRLALISVRVQLLGTGVLLDLLEELFEGQLIGLP